MLYDFVSLCPPNFTPFFHFHLGCSIRFMVFPIPMTKVNIIVTTTPVRIVNEVSDGLQKVYANSIMLGNPSTISLLKKIFYNVRQTKDIRPLKMNRNIKGKAIAKTTVP